VASYDYALVFPGVGVASFAADGPLPPIGLISGPAKVAQRWLLRFLTELGSMPLAPAEGCSFVTLLRQGVLESEMDVYAAFAAAALTIDPLMQADILSTDLLNERYAGAELQDVQVDDSGHLTLSVTVSTAASSINISVGIPL
jgi:hypothetical protein